MPSSSRWLANLNNPTAYYDLEYPSDQVISMARRCLPKAIAFESQPLGKPQQSSMLLTTEKLRWRDCAEYSEAKRLAPQESVPHNLGNTTR